MFADYNYMIVLRRQVHHWKIWCMDSSTGSCLLHNYAGNEFPAIEAFEVMLAPGVCQSETLMSWMQTVPMQASPKSNNRDTRQVGIRSRLPHSSTSYPWLFMVDPHLLKYSRNEADEINVTHSPNISQNIKKEVFNLLGRRRWTFRGRWNKWVLQTNNKMISNERTSDEITTCFEQFMAKLDVAAEAGADLNRAPKPGIRNLMILPELLHVLDN